MSVVGTLRGLDAAHTADDAPVWAKVLGAVLAFGLTLRGGAHVWTVLIGGAVLDEGLDPRTDKQDVRLASPVYSLRGHPLDIAARFVSVALGVALWGMVGAAGHPIAAAYMALQLGVCVADPLALSLWRFKQ